MKSLEQLAVILPCHTLEDFPVRHDEQNAKSLLANWTALWHPSLIARAAQMPDWVSSDLVTCDFENALVLIPIGCVGNIPLEVTAAVDAGKAELVAGLADRRTILQHATFSKWLDQQLEQELVQDFFALGYAYLQVQLMTRQLRYSSSIDMSQFKKSVVVAATAAVKNDVEKAREGLQRCFDLIAEERYNYYPTDPIFLELVLLSESTINKRLENQLACNHPTNWILTRHLQDQIQQQFPESFQQLQQRISERKIDIVGGMNFEVPANLMSVESLTNQLQLGIQQFAGQGTQLQTFASRIHNVGPHLPQLLTQFGFSSTIHAAFSGGDIPTNCAPVMNWQGNDGTNLPALAVTPIDAGSARGFLSLSISIGEMLDGHHHSPLLFVHWPGRVSEYMGDLIRVLHFAPIFGDFSTFTSFNETIYDNGFSENYEADNYRFAWLEAIVQSEEKNPISRFARYWQRHYQIQSLCNATSAIAILEPNSDYKTQLQGLANLQSLNEQTIAKHQSGNAIVSQLKSFTDNEATFACVSRSASLRVESQSAGGQAVFNPTSAKLQLEFEDKSDDANVATLAPFSFVPTNSDAGPVRPNDPNIATVDSDTGLPILRNEFFELRFAPATGGVRSVNRHDKKGNLFSQQLAIRSSETVYQHGFPRQKFQYSVSQLQSIEVSQQRKSSATVRSIIRLVDETSGQEFAEVEQFVTVRRNSHRIDFKVSVRSVREFTGPVWNNYLCSRLALPEKELVWRRSDHDTRVLLSNERVVAPQFVEILEPANSKVTLLPGGLPFHRKSGERMLDTLLIVAGEQVREFDFAVAIDSPTSAAAAIAYLSPPIVLPVDSQYAARNGWIFSLSCKNVVVTYLRPKYGESGKVVGVVMRLIETEKRSGELKIRFPFDLKSAAKTNFLGDKLNELDFEADQIVCNYCENQYFQLECCW